MLLENTFSSPILWKTNSPIICFCVCVRAEFLKDGKIDKKLAEEARENTKKEDDSEVSFEDLKGNAKLQCNFPRLALRECFHSADSRGYLASSQVFGRALMRQLGIIWSKTRKAVENGAGTPPEEEEA